MNERSRGPAGARRAWVLALCLGGLPASAQDAATLSSHAARAEALWEEGRREEALLLFEEALRAEPAEASLRRRLAEAQMATHRYEAALATARGETLLLRDVVGRALYLLGRYDEALAHLDPRDPLEALLAVDAHARLGQPAETWAALERAEASLGTPQAPLLSLRGRLLAADGRYAEALAAFDAALALEPLELGALYGRGQALLRLQRRPEGLAAMESHRELVPKIDRLQAALRAVDLAPLHASNLAELADAERDLGRIERARQIYARATPLANPDEVVPVALRFARLLSEDQQDLEGALAVLEAAAARLPDARLAVRAGDLLAGAGRWADAATRYEEAARLRPGDAAVAERLAEARRRSAPETPP